MTRLLDASFLWIRSRPFLHRFTLFTRILLAVAFLPTGFVKLVGERFTLLAPETPVGGFFEALYQTGLFWRFLGLTQVTAALLLLIPPLAHLGAALFLPIVLNVFVITISLPFGGTPFVTAPMLLAATWLCAWDYHRFRGLVTLAPLAGDVPAFRLDRWELVGFAVFALSLVGFFSGARSFGGASYAPHLVAAGLAAGLFTLGRFLWLVRRGEARGLSAAR